MERRDQSLVDSVLSSGRPLRELRPAFPTWEAALQHYGRIQTEAYGADKPTGTCEGCGAPFQEVMQVISWAAMVYKARWLFWSFVVSLITSLFGFTVEKSLCISFKTRHRICKRCYRGQKAKQALHSLLQPVLFGLLILSLIALVPMFVFGAYLGWEARPVGLLAFIAGAIVLVAAFFGIIDVCSRIPNWIVPRRLRPIGRKPFVMVKIERAG